jgi:hypothetical protein
VPRLRAEVEIAVVAVDKTTREIESEACAKAN